MDLLYLNYIAPDTSDFVSTFLVLQPYESQKVSQGLLYQLETMTTTMSNLPNDLVEEIVSRVPLKSVRNVRLTCKKWNALFKSRSFTKMHIGKEKEAARKLGENRMIVMMDYNVYLMGIIVNENPSIESLGKLTCLHDSEQVKISQVFHCEGLFLCILKDDNTKLVVWNPYLGQTRWIQTRKYYRASGWEVEVYEYALGYKNNSENRSPKILRFIDDFRFDLSENVVLRYEIYDFDTDLWTNLDVSPHWRIISHHDLSLKGNTYWGAVQRNASPKIDHIICFDFTRERFGPLLPLPFKAYGLRFVPLSSVREEKIVAWFQTSEASKVEIWITTKIDAKNVSWSNFFTMNMPFFDEILLYKNFFIDEEKKVVVVSDGERKATQNTINIFGEARCLKKFVLGEPKEKTYWPLLCSYVPSIVPIKQHKGGKRKKNKAIRKGIDINMFKTC